MCQNENYTYTFVPMACHCHVCSFAAEVRKFLRKKEETFTALINLLAPDGNLLMYFYVQHYTLLPQAGHTQRVFVGVGSSLETPPPPLNQD